ncbi:MAG: elongation factor P, partial [Candidatus Omnitrophica bacterium]|nr:elongation factor P [Candidatus Omnitrophota bacterium]
MGLSINDVKPGLTILVENEVYLVLEADHVKPGKGSAFVRAKLKNLKNGAVQDRTFKADDEIEPAFVEERKLQYLYNSANIYYFMDQETFEEISIPNDYIQDKIKFLKDNLEVTACFYKYDLLNINLPNSVEYKVIHTEPGFKGDTAKSGSKPAQIETGAIIQVPLFIEAGDIIKVDTRTGEYI